MWADARPVTRDVWVDVVTKHLKSTWCSFSCEKHFFKKFMAYVGKTFGSLIFDFQPFFTVMILFVSSF